MAKKREGFFELEGQKYLEVGYKVGGECPKFYSKLGFLLKSVWAKETCSQIITSCDQRQVTFHPVISHSPLEGKKRH